MPTLGHPLLRHFLLGHAHANSATPQFSVEDIEFDSLYIAAELTPDAVEAEMANLTTSDEFWYQLGRLADMGYTLIPSEGSPDPDLLCFQYLEETL